MIKKIAQIVAISMLPLFIYAQDAGNSPYSRFGVGDVLSNKYNRNFGMGGISMGVRANNIVNPSNPASYTAFDTLSFVFETGLYGSANKVSTESSSQKNYNGTLGYLTCGFPVTKWWSASVGLIPYSQRSFSIQSKKEVDSVIGNVYNLFEGSGGIDRFYVGSALKVSKSLSIGANASYMFGQLKYRRAVYFPSSSNCISLNDETTVNPQDFMFDFAAQYTRKVGKVQMTLGARYSPFTKLKVKSDILSYTDYDTVRDDKYIESQINMPQSIGGGFVFEKSGQWKIGADVITQDWSKFSMLGQTDSLKNSIQACIGGEWIPNSNATKGYFNKVRYRLGMRYEKNYIQLKNNQLTESGVQFGLGLPIGMRRMSMLNVGVEVGQNGTTSDNLVKEQFIRVVVGFSLYEHWFYKRKYE